MSAPERLTPGHVVAGHRILSLLGRGGMAEIYLARPLAPHSTPVVLKVLRADVEDEDRSAHRMFLREAAVARQMSHPNVVRVLDLAQFAGHRALIIEFLDGRHLNQLGKVCYDKKRYLPYTAITAIMRRLLGALAYVHELQSSDGRPLRLIHRDISPDNVVITFGGEVKLVDFGIARSGHAALKAARTQTGVLRGKARYTSPEAVAGEALDARSDLFALGVVLYELLTYARPFEGASPPAIFDAISNVNPPAPSTRNKRVPPALDAACMRALAKNPAERFQSAREMAAALGEEKAGEQEELAALMESLFPAVTDPDRVKLRLLLREDVDEPTAEFEPTNTGMSVGLLAEALLDDED